MQCPHCHKFNTKPLYCKTKKGFDRLECLNCKTTFSENTGKFFFRNRFPKWIIMTAVLLCLFTRARNARLLVYILFGIKISTKSMLKWTRKYLNNLPNFYPGVNIKKKLYLILHADEKFFKINGKWHYWWSLIDNAGNLITCFISEKRDLISAKKLFKDARIVLKSNVDFIITDGLQAYVKAKNIFGRKCRHIRTGIKGKFVNPKGGVFWINNNRAESLNSEIDIFLSRFRYNFRNINSARRWMKCFIFCNYLLRLFEQQYSSEVDSDAGISLKSIIADPLTSFTEE